MKKSSRNLEQQVVQQQNHPKNQNSILYSSLGRVISILQLCYKSSRKGRGCKIQLSLNKPFIQLLEHFTQQLNNPLVRKVTEESARIQQSVWDPGKRTKLGVHQLLPRTATNEWRISHIKFSPIHVQSILSIRRLGQMERTLLGSMCGIYWLPIVIDQIQGNWKGLVHIL